jgi:poly-gamma-glutamate capsule biosynthesis protein CapA/YwtB (metallophosphatase superfamily)
LHRHLLIAVLVLLTLAACQSGLVTTSQVFTQTEVIQESASPTSSQTPTLTLTPTLTITPSITPSLTPTPTITPIPRTVLLFTGVIVPARCVQAGIDARNDHDYLYNEVRDIITKADLAIGTLNATMSDITPHKGCVRTYVLVGDSENADAMARAGFDVMSVATNHIKNCSLVNCGDQAFYDTMANLRRVNILPVGAGNNLAEAEKPVVVTVNGVRFGIVSLGQIEPLSFASDTTPGIAILTKETLTKAITEARAQSDVVIAMPHWGPEDDPIPNSSQRSLARVAVEAGADLVVGNHTHVIQAFKEINGVMVFYGLGNFVFDQTWKIDHQQGMILRVTFEGTRFVGYDYIFTHVDQDGTVHIANPEESASILARIEHVNQDVP